MHGKTLNMAALAGFPILLIAACAHDTSHLHGAAARHMKEQQIQNLDAAYNPDPTPVVGGDVYRLDDVLEAHRNNAKDLTEDYGAVVITEY